MDTAQDRSPADLRGRTPLHYAALFGDLHRAIDLVEGGTDVHTTDLDGQTALHLAAQGCAVAVAELLIANDAVVDAPDACGNTPLWNAVLRTRGEGPIVDLLVGRGADLHHANDDGRTPAQLGAALTQAARGLTG